MISCGPLLFAYVLRFPLSRSDAVSKRLAAATIRTKRLTTLDREAIFDRVAPADSLVSDFGLSHASGETPTDRVIICENISEGPANDLIRRQLLRLCPRLRLINEDEGGVGSGQCSVGA